MGQSMEEMCWVPLWILLVQQYFQLPGFPEILGTDEKALQDKEVMKTGELFQWEAEGRLETRGVKGTEEMRDDKGVIVACHW